MKRMIPYLLIASAGLSVCGWLVLRHAVRTAGEAPRSEGSGLPLPGRTKAVDQWQEGLRIDTRADYKSSPRLNKDAEEKLRREELRQKPWERRN